MAPDRQPLIAALSAEASAGEANPGVEEVLDAALAQFEDLGIRRSTIEDIARRAGIDRVTVYRRVGSKDDVTQTVIAREVHRMMEEVVACGERSAAHREHQREGGDDIGVTEVSPA